MQDPWKTSGFSADPIFYHCQGRCNGLLLLYVIHPHIPGDCHGRLDWNPVLPSALSQPVCITKGVPHLYWKSCGMGKGGLRDPGPHRSPLMTGLTALAIPAGGISISSSKLPRALGQSLSGKRLPRAEGGRNSLELKDWHFPVGMKCQGT